MSKERVLNWVGPVMVVFGLALIGLYFVASAATPPVRMDPDLAAQIALAVASQPRATDWTGIALAITAVGTIITGVGAIWMQVRTRKAVERADANAKIESIHVAAKTEQVKATLEQTTKGTEAKLDALEKTTVATHVLVNSNYGIQLRVAWVALQRVSDLTGAPEDAEAAKLAKAALDDHIAKQAKVDETAKGDKKSDAAAALVTAAEVKAERLVEVAKNVAVEVAAVEKEQGK